MSKVGIYSSLVHSVVNEDFISKQIDKKHLKIETINETKKNLAQISGMSFFDIIENQTNHEKDVFLRSLNRVMANFENNKEQNDHIWNSKDQPIYIDSDTNDIDREQELNLHVLKLNCRNSSSFESNGTK